MIQLAASSLTFDGFEDANFANTFALAPKAGYKRLEINCWYPRTLTPKKMRELRRRCEESGLVPIALHVGSFGGDTRDSLTMNLCHKIRAAEAAVELGCRRVAASGMERGTNGGLEGVITVLKELAPVAEERDVLICLENHCMNNLENTEDYLRVMEAVPSSHIGICVDTGHFDAAGVDIPDFIDRLFPRIVHVHLKENNGFGVKRFCRFGEGTTDNAGIVQKLADMGYSGYLSVEISPEIGENGGDAAFTIEDLSRPVKLFAQYAG